MIYFVYHGMVWLRMYLNAQYVQLDLEETSRSTSSHGPNTSDFTLVNSRASNPCSTFTTKIRNCCNWKIRRMSIFFLRTEQLVGFHRVVTRAGHVVCSMLTTQGAAKTAGSLFGLAGQMSQKPLETHRCRWLVFVCILQSFSGTFARCCKLIFWSI